MCKQIQYHGPTMETLDTRLLRPQTETVTVYTRHSATCPKVGDGAWRKCRCLKYLYTLKDGKRSTISAKTRSWEKAEEQAQRIRDRWDPVKQKLKALEAEKVEKEIGEVTIEAALKRWIASLHADLDNKYTRRKYETTARKIEAWAKHVGLTLVSQVSADHLDHWRSLWSSRAQRVDDRMGKTTAGRHLEKVKAFFKYCKKLRWITQSPATDLKAIKGKQVETLPLLDGRYEMVLAATYKYDEGMRPDDRYGAELRALIELMRWTGLRISDALMVARERINGNHFRLRTVKSGAKHTVILPDHVVGALNALTRRDTVDPRYFFWTGKSELKSLTGQWQRKLGRLNKYLSMVDYDGKPMRFHSHQLRDTFAVQHLLAGTSMEDLSKMLSHKSIRITEKYYAPWVPARQVQLEEKMIAAMERMGGKVSLGA